MHVRFYTKYIHACAIVHSCAQKSIHAHTLVHVHVYVFVVCVCVVYILKSNPNTPLTLRMALVQLCEYSISEKLKPQFSEEYNTVCTL